MKVSITGADGFIGQWVTKKLIEEGYDVRTLDRNTENLLVPVTLRDFVEKASTIVHIAGKNKATEAELYTSNTVSTLGLVRAVEAFGSGRTHVIYASSVQVYEPTESLELLRETHQTSSSNAFAGSKLLAEDLLRKWSDFGVVNSTVMRISNAYGPGCRPYYNSVIATFVDRSRKGEMLEVSGSGAQTRDFLFISDLTDAVLALVRSTPHRFRIFNVSTGKGTSLLNVAQKIQGIVPGTRLSVEGDGSGRGSFLVADPSRLRHEVGFRPKVSLDEGLRLSLNL